MNLRLQESPLFIPYISLKFVTVTDSSLHTIRL